MKNIVSRYADIVLNRVSLGSYLSVAVTEEKGTTVYHSAITKEEPAEDVQAKLDRIAVEDGSIVKSIVCEPAMLYTGVKTDWTDKLYSVWSHKIRLRDGRTVTLTLSDCVDWDISVGTIGEQLEDIFFKLGTVIELGGA